MKMHNTQKKANSAWRCFASFQFKGVLSSSNLVVGSISSFKTFPFSNWLLFWGFIWGTLLVILGFLVLEKVRVFFFVWGELVAARLGFKLLVEEGFLLVEVRLSTVSSRTQLSGFDTLFKFFLVTHDNAVYLLADVFLSALLLQNQFSQRVRIILLLGVCNSHFKLSLFLFQFDVVYTVDRRWYNHGLLNYFNWCLLNRLLFQCLWLLFAVNFLMFCFFLHWVLLQAFYNYPFGHKSCDLVFEVGLALVGVRVHFLYAFLRVILKYTM